MKLREKYWHEFFVVGIIFKSLTGLAETASGLVLLVIRPEVLRHILTHLAAPGYQPRDFDDLLLSYPYQYLQHLTAGDKLFAGFYILAHGLINLVLVMGLIKEKLAAYLVAIGVLASFVMYQSYRIALTRSPFLEILTCLDVLFIIVLWHEYRYQLKRRSAGLQNR